MKAETVGDDEVSYGEEGSALRKADEDDGVSYAGDGDTMTREATLFTDENGILKFVKLVCNRPFTIFFITFAIVSIMTNVLNQILQAGGNPFTDQSVSSYDINDVRSEAYDSLNLAHKEIVDARKAQDSTARTQEESIDFTYWVWEAEKDTGVFGDVESIEGMKEAIDIFLQAEDYDKYCLHTYDSDASDGECQPPFSALRIYYASNWDYTKAGEVLDVLKEANVLGTDKSGLELFNDLSLCEFTNSVPICECITAPENATLGVCDAESLPARAWYQKMNGDIESIMDQWDGRGSLVQEDKLDFVTEFSSYMIQLYTKKGLTEFGFDKNFNSTNKVSMYSRAVLEWGSPLEVTTDDDAQSDPDLTEQEKDGKIIAKWVSSNLLDDMDKVANVKHDPNVNSYYFMGSLLNDVFLKVVLTDMLFVLAAVLLVAILIYIGTGSVFLAFIGWLEIVLTVPVSWFIYKLIFQIDLFPGLNTLSIFIVAAIGADDIFVFMDAYKQSAYMGDVLDSFEKRMDYVYRRSGLAMAITSATTCTAFLCTLITPIPIVKAFGIFAAIVIFIDYVLVMTLFCSAVVVYHNKFEGRCCDCNCKNSDPNPTEVARQLTKGEWDGNDEVEHADSLRRSQVKREKGEKISMFFRERVSSFVFNPIVRMVLAVLFVGWVIGSIYLTTTLEATKETDPFFRESHPLQRSIDIINEEFELAELAGEPGLLVYFAWGLDIVNRKGVNLFFNDNFIGKPTYLDFQFNEQCQNALLEVCDDFSLNEEYEPQIKRSQGRAKVSCFIKELAAFRTYGDDMKDHCEEVMVEDKAFWDTQDWNIPVEDVNEVMKEFVKQKSCQVDAQSRTITTYYDKELGWDGKDLKYAAISVENPELTASEQTAESITRKQYDAYVEMTAAVDEIALNACGGNSIMTDLNQKWMFMHAQNIYVKSAIESAILGIAIAFTVLLVSTKVLHIAVFAAISITCTLISVTAAMVINGWTIGSLESILITILAGFSIDYVVHLAHAYKEASGDTYERTKTAFGEMGVSVLNGMLTSVVASLPMFFTTLIFFSKFAFFLCFTILFSWIFANFGFMSTLVTLNIPIVKRKWGFSW